MRQRQILLAITLCLFGHAQITSAVSLGSFFNDKVTKFNQKIENISSRWDTTTQSAPSTKNKTIQYNDIPEYGNKINMSQSSKKSPFSQYSPYSQTNNNSTHNEPVYSLDDQYQNINIAIKQASRKTGLPESLIKAMIKKESNFNPNNVSRSGAIGLTQVMPATAASECNLNPDELYDINKNITCGTNYLAKLVYHFDDYELGLAAYNAGPGAVKRAITQVGSKDINAVTSVLKAETAPYVQKIMAYKQNYEA